MDPGLTAATPARPPGDRRAPLPARPSRAANWIREWPQKNPVFTPSPPVIITAAGTFWHAGGLINDRSILLTGATMGRLTSCAVLVLGLVVMANADAAAQKKKKVVVE